MVGEDIPASWLAAKNRCYGSVPPAGVRSVLLTGMPIDGLVLGRY